jgi:hypothetical protein
MASCYSDKLLGEVKPATYNQIIPSKATSITFLIADKLRLDRADCVHKFSYICAAIVEDI